MRIQTFKIEDIGPSLNKYYSGTHWTNRKKDKDKWTNLTIEAVTNIDSINDYPVKITYYCYFGKGKRGYDSTNCSAIAKLIEDGMVEANILNDDSNKYVVSTELIPIVGNGEHFVFVMIEEPYTNEIIKAIENDAIDNLSFDN